MLLPKQCYGILKLLSVLFKALYEEQHCEICCLKVRCIPFGNCGGRGISDEKTAAKEEPNTWSCVWRGISGEKTAAKEEEVA